MTMMMQKWSLSYMLSLWDAHRAWSFSHATILLQQAHAELLHPTVSTYSLFFLQLQLLGALQTALFSVWSKFGCVFPGHGSATKLRTAEQELFSNLQAWATLWRLMQLLIVVVVAAAAAAAGVRADEGAAAKSTSTSLLHRGHLGCDFSSITYMRQCVQAPMTSCAQLAVSSCSDDAGGCCCCFLLLLLLSTSPT